MDAVKQISVVVFIGFVSISAMAQATVADRLSVMDAQVQILNKQIELNSLLERSAGSSVAGLPTVVSIGNSVGGPLSARIMLGNGQVENFVEGDRLRGSMWIAAITPRGVVVRLGEGKKARTMPLEFAMPKSGIGSAPGAPGSPVPRELLPEAPPVGGMRLPTPAPAAAAAPAAASATTPAPAK